MSTRSLSIDRIIQWSLIVSNAIFLVLFMLLGYYNRLAVDDFHFLSLAKSHGIIEATLIEHDQWSGRWASVVLVQIVLRFKEHGLFLYGISILILFILAVSRIIGHKNMLFDRPPINKWLRLNLAVFIVSAFFHASIGIDETWFWLCASATYWVGMVMLLLGISAILYPGRSNWEPVLCALTFSYVGGSSEPLALFVLLMLAAAIAYGAIRNSLPLNKILIAFIACLVSFIIMFIGEGNRVREQFFEEIGIWRTTILNVKTTGMIILLKLPRIIPSIVIFSLPAFAVARISSNGILPRSNVIRRVAFIILTFFAALYIYQFPVTYATQDIAADRALFPVTLLALLAGASIFHTLGRAGVSNVRHAQILTLGAVTCIILINAYTLQDQLKVVPEYGRAHDQRIEYLESRKQNTGILLVEPLPPSGLLFSAEVSTDPGHFANRHLKAGLGLKADVVRVSVVSTKE